MSWGKLPKALTKKLRNEALVVTSTSYDVTFRPQALLWGRHGITKCVPLSLGRDHLSIWSAGCLVEKPCPLESQKPTSKPWPIRLLVLLGIVLVWLLGGDVRFDGLLLLYECSTTSTRRLRRPRDSAPLRLVRVADDVQRSAAVWSEWLAQGAMQSVHNEMNVSDLLRLAAKAVASN